MRRQTFHGEGAGDPHPLVVLVGLVVKDFGLGAACDGRVDLGLAVATGLPARRVQAYRVGPDL